MIDRAAGAHAFACNIQPLVAQIAADALDIWSKGGDDVRMLGVEIDRFAGVGLQIIELMHFNKIPERIVLGQMQLPFAQPDGLQRVHPIIVE